MFDKFNRLAKAKERVNLNLATTNCSTVKYLIANPSLRTVSSETLIYTNHKVASVL